MCMLWFTCIFLCDDFEMLNPIFIPIPYGFKDDGICEYVCVIKILIWYLHSYPMNNEVFGLVEMLLVGV